MKLILSAIKWCKKVISILLICTMLLTCVGFTDRYQIDEAKKMDLLSQAQVVDWNTFDDIMDMGARFIMIDYHTGKYVVCERHMGGLHADVETVDKKATDVLKSMYNDRDTWKHRPVLIVFEDGSVFCASSFIVGHAGRDNAPTLKMIDNRSHGYGRGENYDTIHGNGLDGHICVHVRKAKNHFNGKESSKHQANIDYLEKEKSKLN